jgi:hypothetical protein
VNGRQGWIKAPIPTAVTALARRSDIPGGKENKHFYYGAIPSNG